LDFAIARFVKEGIGVQVDAHVHLPALRGMAGAPEVADKFVAWWTAFAVHLSKTTDPEFVFLEVLNEPGGVGFYGAAWSAFQDRLIMAIRAAAPKHTLIANGGGYMLWDKDTIKLAPHPDRNIIYAVHYYEPSQFTHQGAQWMKPMYQPLRNVPWPCDESNLQAALDSIVRQGWTGRLAGADKAAEEFLKNMVKDGLGQPRKMNENFDCVADWAKKNGVRVVINEFGVYVPYAPAASRFRWMADMRKTAESHGFGWAHWDYCTGMPIVAGEPGARQIDPQAAAALGLNTNSGK
jgi:aryl-phospho-beta-D-glucosidase BglC (GH1 family)